MTHELESLRVILNEAVDSIIATCKQKNEEFPSLNSPAHPSEFSPLGIRNDPVVSQAIKLGVAAAHQLIVTLQSPMQTMVGIGAYTTLPANVAVAERTHVAEIIRQHGKEGMCASDIVKYNGTSADKLERILRHLATHHVFREVSPGVFAHNMLSSLLDTGKDYETIIKDPDAKFDGTNGIAAYVSSLTSEQPRTFASTVDLMTDLPRAASEELNDSSVQLAYHMDLTYWQFLELPENDFRSRRFNIAMRGLSSMQPPGTILKTYDWESLPEKSVIVDVGSGLGHVSLEVASVRPDLTFILEDRSAVLRDAEVYWAQRAPEIAKNAHFITTDYLAPQPQLPATPDIFLLRYILHNLSDKYATILLTHLHAAAKAATKLIVVDYVVEHACITTQNSESSNTIPGAAAPTAPPPLLPNYGVAGALTYQMDMIMLAHFNAKERTIEHWTNLFSASGWRLVKVNRDPVNKTDWPLLVAEVDERRGSTTRNFDKF